MRIAIAPTHRTEPTIATIHPIILELGGSTKLGSTPCGGVIDGPSSSIFCAAGDNLSNMSPNLSIEVIFWIWILDRSRLECRVQVWALSCSFYRLWRTACAKLAAYQVCRSLLPNLKLGSKMFHCIFWAFHWKLPILFIGHEKSQLLSVAYPPELCIECSHNRLMVSRRLWLMRRMIKNVISTQVCKFGTNVHLFFTYRSVWRPPGMTTACLTNCSTAVLPRAGILLLVIFVNLIPPP